MLAAFSFVNRSLGNDGVRQALHGYHRDKLRGAMLLAGATRAIQNCLLDTGDGVRAALALATGMGVAAAEAAVSYCGGSKMLVVDAEVLRDPPLYHANLSTGGQPQQRCRSLSRTYNLAALDGLAATRLANIGSPKVTIGCKSCSRAWQPWPLACGTNSCLAARRPLRWR